MAHDLGDFQTPPGLVTRVLACLQRHGKVYERVLEPTCGTGTFIAGLLHMPVPPSEIQAIELQQSYADTATMLCANNTTTHIVVQQANFFQIDLNSSLTWKTQGNLLVVGNPPWVTNATLGSLGSSNLPEKENLKRLRGIDARTGSSNFDIAESIWLKLITELRAEHPTIALLCKTSVARNVLKYCHDMHVPVDRASIVRIDAGKWFHVAVDACLFCVDVGTVPKRYTAHIYPDLDSIEPETTIGIQNGHVIAHMQSYDDVADIDGRCSLTWRQGIKHDAASVMELVHANTPLLMNKLGESVDVEEEYVYPLLKGTDVFKHARLHRFVLVTQKYLGDDTDKLQHIAPRLWAYLKKHANVFARRKSSIYANQPEFALFGIGDYTFAPYKIAISGLHKTPVFRSIGPVNQKPVLLDDTCYFLPLYDALETACVASLLNEDGCVQFLTHAMFQDAKRPVTKKLLQRINLDALIERADHDQLVQRAMGMYQSLRRETDDSCGQNGSFDSTHTIRDRLEQLLVSYQMALPQTGQVKMSL